MYKKAVQILAEIRAHAHLENPAASTIGMEAIYTNARALKEFYAGCINQQMVMMLSAQMPKLQVLHAIEMSLTVIMTQSALLAYHVKDL